MPPVNDDIAAAVTLTGASGTEDGDNTAATLEAGEGALLYDVDNGLFDDIGYGGGRSVWYQWTAPADGDYGFWTGATDGSFDFVGLEDSIVTVLDGDDFFTATVLIQNEFSQGLELEPSSGTQQYPWSLAQFTAVSGNTYFIGVDGYNGDKPSDGGYDINNTNEGPFRLYWGVAVDAFPAIKNCSILSVTATTATYQFEINPQSPSGGDYWARAYNPDLSLGPYDSPHGHETAGFVWSTVTSTVTGLQPNTPWIINHVLLSNTTDETQANCDDFFTLLPTGFGTCPADESDTFTGDDCTAPAGWTSTDGLRLQGNALGAYEWQEVNYAIWQGTALSSNPLTEIAGDVAVTLPVVSGKQSVGWLEAVTDGYWVRSDADAGTLELILVTAGVESVLDSAAVTFVDGDRIGIRYEGQTNTISGYRYTGGVWSSALVSAVDTSIDLFSQSLQASVQQTAPTGPPAVDDSMCFDLSIYGTITQAMKDSIGGGGCPVGTNKYTWGFPGFHVWSGPYVGGSADNDYPNPAVDCPNWWLDLKVHAMGRIDCDLESIGNTGDDGFMITSLTGQGVTAALPPFYPATAEYDAELDQFESDSFGGFLVWDTDFAHKGMDAIQSTLDSVQGVFAADGAVKINNVGDGGRNSYGVFMPVAVAPGRIDNFFLSFERCAVNFGPVSFSHLTTTRRRGVLSVR